jgi:hypothetical protein
MYPDFWRTMAARIRDGYNCDVTKSHVAAVLAPVKAACQSALDAAEATR